MIYRRAAKDNWYRFVNTRQKSAGDKLGACAKICHVSRKKAQAAIKATVTSGREQSTKTTTFESYFCDKCDAYHIGHRGVKYESADVGRKVSY